MREEPALKSGRPLSAAEEEEKEDEEEEDEEEEEEEGSCRCGPSQIGLFRSDK